MSLLPERLRSRAKTVDTDPFIEFLNTMLTNVGLTADRLRPTDDMRLGLALAELYEQRLSDPGRAMVEVRRHFSGTPS